MEGESLTRREEWCLGKGGDHRGLSFQHKRVIIRSEEMRESDFENSIMRGLSIRDSDTRRSLFFKKPETIRPGFLATESLYRAQSNYERNIC